MNDVPEVAAAPPEWIAVLEESAEDIAAGRTVPGSVVLQMIRETLARMEKRDREAESAR
jgi:hypothetical protein